MRVRRLFCVQRRNFSLTDILADPSRQFLTSVSECSKNGFVINNVVVRKPVLLLPKTFLIWNTKSFEDIDVRSLSLFTFLYPTLEVLIIGCGKESKKRLPREVREFFQLRGIVVDQMDSMNAVQTFNVLISEGRNVGAAIIPPFDIANDEFNPAQFN